MPWTPITTGERGRQTYAAYRWLDRAGRSIRQNYLVSDKEHVGNQNHTQLAKVRDKSRPRMRCDKPRKDTVL